MLVLVLVLVLVLPPGCGQLPFPGFEAERLSFLDLVV